jgi:hypothetical protein
VVGAEPHALEVVASAAWGDGPDEVDEVLEDYPAFADMSLDQLRQVRAPLRIRLDADGRLHALADAGARRGAGFATLHGFDARGAAISRTALPDVDADTRIVDFAVDPDGDVYVLQRSASAPHQTSNRLRKIDRTGDEAWSRTCGLRRLAFDGRDLLVGLPTNERGAIARIDTESGAVQLDESGPHGDDLFVDESGTIRSVVYFPEERRRGLATSQLGSAQSWTAQPLGADAYRWLTWVVGIDASSRIYGWNDGAIARIAPDGEIVVLASFHGVAIGPDGSVFASRPIAPDDESGALRIDRYGPGGAEAMSLPLTAGSHDGWRLVHVDDRARLYVHGGEAPGTPGTLLVYSPDGGIEDALAPPPDLLALESRLTSHSDWIVDARGRVLIPMTDPGGFKVLALNA